MSETANLNPSLSIWGRLPVQLDIHMYAYRSAILSIHDKVDGVDVGQHLIITRLLKGVDICETPFRDIQTHGTYSSG